MKRRTVVWRIAASATQGLGGAGRVVAQSGGRVPRIGVLRWGVPSDESRAGLAGALDAMGYREGTTIKIEWRWATRPEDAQRYAVKLAAMDLIC